MKFDSMLSPLGWITIFEHEKNIVALELGVARKPKETPLLNEIKKQLKEYFSSRRKLFDIPLNPAGTCFQKLFWGHLEQVQHGNTTTYGNIARLIKSSPRAVGGACAKNPIPILIPCHRVVGTNGNLTGFSLEGGTQTKDFLLKLES